MFQLRTRLLGLAVFLLVSSCANAQIEVSPSDAALVNKILDARSIEGEPLKCQIRQQQPILDFAFRYDVGYVVRCPVKEFEGKASTVLTFVRVTPEGGTSKILGEAYGLGEMPAGTRARVDLKKLKAEFDFSGGFSAGEGRYVVDLLVAHKESGRACRKSWKVSVSRKHGEAKVPITVPERTAVPMMFYPWSGKPEAIGTGLRITVLLDAAPIYPFAQKLRAWDRSFLLSTLSTVLDHIACESVRVVAFNLDQQREIFRDELRDQPGLIRLNQAMRDLELGTVSYQVLQRHAGANELLARLARTEQGEANPSDLVILLGPHTRYTDKVPPYIFEGLRKSDTDAPQFFYLEYMPFWLRGAEFADNLEQVTKAVGGKSYRFYSPADLADSIRKITEMQQNRRR
ncbi:MAG TPA: hypothetical protein VJQ54_17625 [Candidatus Sulfotelmatobacter sp.]|nr:hypothetical protein [Candidatus Sulfotelmatobacter sp.]